MFYKYLCDFYLNISQTFNCSHKLISTYLHLRPTSCELKMRYTCIIIGLQYMCHKEYINVYNYGWGLRYLQELGSSE